MTTQMPNLPVAISQASPPMRANDAIARFTPCQRLSVRQKRRWLELLFNWEQKNSYAIYNEMGQHVMQVREEGNGFVELLKRLFLKTWRPYEAVIYDNGMIPQPLVILKKRFRWIFHVIEVYAPDGTPLGNIEVQWSWFRRILLVRDGHGRVMATLFGPILKPWTFEIHLGDAAEAATNNTSKPIGLIQKRWSGFTSEFLTDADNYAADLSNINDSHLKLLLMASMSLLDMVYFENMRSRKASWS